MEKRKTKLSYKIQQALKTGPSTNDRLAKQLGQSLKSVESQTFRMARTGEIKKVRRGVYADSAYVESTSATKIAPTRLPGPDVFKQVESRPEPAKPVDETAAPVPLENDEQSSGPENVFIALYQQASQEWKWGLEKFTEMYYTIGKDAINHWLAVYRANTKYVGRLAPAEFEDLVNKLGIEQIESVVQKQKHERERIGAREMEASDDDIDNDEDELAHVSGYRTMEAKPLPTAEAKSLKTYKLNFRY